MKNAYSPTYEEIKDRAHNNEQYYPEQDWDALEFPQGNLSGRVARTRPA
jgi:hypothetical protein